MGCQTAPNTTPGRRLLAGVTCQPIPNIPTYGGRGIRVCDEWRRSFSAFFAHIGKRPSPRHSLDRWPNNDGNYEPGNCRWATRKEQQRNTRSNRWIEYCGKRMVVEDWAALIGMSAHGLLKRLKRGYPLYLALSPERLPCGHPSHGIGSWPLEAAEEAQARERGLQGCASGVVRHDIQRWMSARKA